MNKVIRRLLISIIIVSTLLSTCLLISCDNTDGEKNKSYEYSTDTFNYSELHNGTYKTYSAKKTTTDYANYIFDNNIVLEQRNRFVDSAEELFDNLKPEGLQDNPLTFFISNDIKTPRAETEKNTVYFSLSNIKTVEFINYVLQGLNTNTLNYGLLYGVSSQIFAELKWGETNILSESQIKNFLEQESNRWILDLTYPAFEKKFSSGEQIKYAKSISIRLVGYIEETHGKESIKELFEADKVFDLTFDNLFYGYLNEWLDVMDIEGIEVGSEVSKCIPYTTDFPFRIITNSCDYFFDKDWEEDRIVNYYTYKDFVFNYPSTKNFLLDTEPEYKLVREFFDYDDDNKVPVLLQYMYSGGLAYSNYFIISSVYALVHEYSHVISFLKYGRFTSWVLEGIANYCWTVFDDVHSKEHFVACNDLETFINVVGDMPELSKYVLNNYMNGSTNENYCIRFLEGYFYVLFFERNINLHEKFDEYSDNPSFAAGFSDFLINAYGKEKYITLYKNQGDFSVAYDKSKTELIDEYLQYLYEIFN